MVPAGLGCEVSSRSASANTVAPGTTARPSLLLMTSPTNSPVVVNRNEPAARSVPDGTAHTVSGHAAALVGTREPTKDGRSETPTGVTSLEVMYLGCSARRGVHGVSGMAAV